MLDMPDFFAPSSQYDADANGSSGHPDRITIFDTTLRDGEQSPGCTMNLIEKLEVAHQLARLGVDVIEAGFPICSPEDFESVRRIAEEVGNLPNAPVICGLARAVAKDIERAGEAIKGARNGRIHTFIATSKIHLEKKLRKSREEVIAEAVEAVKLARTYTGNVEFSCEDAGRSDIGYIVEILTATIEAGATTLNIPDTVGYCSPEQYGGIIAHIRRTVPGIEKVVLSTHCHNDLGLAVANSLAGVMAGARQVECTINGLGERAGNASLEEIVMNLKVRRDYYRADTGVNTRELYRASKMVSQITGMRVQRNKAIVGGNAFAHEAGIHQDGILKDKSTYEIMTPESVGWTGENLVLGKHSGRHAIKARLAQLGFDALNNEQMDRVFDAFKTLCDKKREVFDDDLTAIVEEEIFSERRTDYWQLDQVQVVTGTHTLPTASVVMHHSDSGRREESSVGDGPVEAVFKAIQRLTGIDGVLVAYNIDSVTRGKDALGQVVLRVERSGGLRAQGKSVDTDIIVASAKAYVEALNRLELMGAMMAAATSGEVMAPAVAREP